MDDQPFPDDYLNDPSDWMYPTNTFNLDGRLPDIAGPSELSTADESQFGSATDLIVQEPGSALARTCGRHRLTFANGAAEPSTATSSQHAGSVQDDTQSHLAIHGTQHPTTTEKARSRKTRKGKNSGIEELLTKNKVLIKRIYLHENVSANDTRLAMEQMYGITIGLSYFTDLLHNRWKWRKNNTKFNSRDLEDEDMRHPRKKKNVPRLSVGWNQVASIRASIPSGTRSTDCLVRVLRECFGNLFPKSSSAGHNYHAVDTTWSHILDQCVAAAALARLGMQSRFNFKLQQAFNSIWQATEDPGPSADFFIYFWRIALTLRDLRCHGVQRLPQNKFAFLYILLKYLALRYKKVLGDRHYFYQFSRWICNSFESDPRRFKDLLGGAYESTILCFKEAIGQNHRVIVSMESHRARHWRQQAPLKGAKNDCTDESTSLLMDYMAALSLSDNKDDLDKVCELAKQLRGQTISWCQSENGTPLKFDCRTRGLAYSTDWLFKMFQAKKNAEGLENLGEAIDVLSRGDQESCICAASFSRRRTLWLKSFLNYKPPRVKKRPNMKRQKRQQDPLEEPQRDISDGKTCRVNTEAQLQRQQKEVDRQETAAQCKAEKARLEAITRKIPAAPVMDHGEPSQYRAIHVIVRDKLIADV
ncbi:C6 transcription factor [Purpureocillium lavendulum]|uniref:C6 transcription factor n=1 Tax=Purpureocillium lavendulum TaxID=1247861 RepID=A0AB34FBE7_9HYPO|nr:C6 transcription factor [Purpureocillium lavendulum]